MIPTRPNTDEFMELIDQLADKKAELADLEFELEVYKADAVKKAMAAGAKTRAIDYIKIIGNTEEDTQYIRDKHNQINAIRKEISVLYGKVEAWKANKDIYRSDSYHQVSGRVGSIFEGEQE